jgi:hypothetical protein
MEKNCPTDSSKWSSYKSQAKKEIWCLSISIRKWLGS